MSPPPCRRVRWLGFHHFSVFLSFRVPAVFLIGVLLEPVYGLAVEGDVSL